MRKKTKFLSLSILALALFLFPVLVQAQMGQLSGRVINQTGSALSGTATVEVLDPATSAVVSSATTDTTGFYQMAVADGTYDVRVIPPAGSGFGTSVALARTIAGATVIDFILVPAGTATLSGRLLDGLGVGMANQSIRLYPTSGGGAGGNTQTDAQGGYAFQVSPGTYNLSVMGSNGSLTDAAPMSYHMNVSEIVLSSSLVLDIQLPVKRVSIHVQDLAGNPVSGVGIGASGGGGTFMVGGFTGSGSSSYYYYSPPPNMPGMPPMPPYGAITDSQGNVLLWLFPTPPPPLQPPGMPVMPVSGYTFTATPPQGSPFATFNIQNIAVTSDKSEIVILQFVHDPPVTTASLSPASNGSGQYPDPTTVTLSAAAFTGYTVASTTYSIDGGASRSYTGPFVITGSGPHVIRYASKDNGGVFEIPKTLTFEIAVLARPPVVEAGPDKTIDSEKEKTTTIAGTITDPYGQALQYRWLDGSTVLQAWNVVGSDGQALLDSAKLQGLSLGEHDLVLEVSDGRGTYTDHMSFTINNSAPHAAPSGAGRYLINTAVPLEGQVSDYDGDLLVYEWLAGGKVLLHGMAATAIEGYPVHLSPQMISNLGLGMHTLTLRVNDGVNPPVSASMDVEIFDNVAPILSPAPDKTILWPANHKMVKVSILANTRDNSGGPTTIKATVTSNEPQDGLGDGDTYPDWTEPVIMNGMITLDLRAERSGKGKGRTYTVAIESTDASGNASKAKVNIAVPHDKGK